MKEYRALTDIEILKLEANGCRAQSWQEVSVAEGFDASYVVGCSFSGTVNIGSTGQEVELSEGVKVRGGLYSSHIINSTIGDGCYISNVGEYIANQAIGNRVIISGTSRIEASKDNTFGNGVLVATINEGGGREVPISDKLSAQTAYMVAMYGHRPAMREAYCAMVKNYTDSIRSDKGIIEDGAKILSAGIIKNSRIKAGVTVEGARLIDNCTIGSYIGPGVSIDSSIVDSNSSIDSSAIVSHCYVGSAVKIAKSFFAEHSLFFCGSDMALGEACSIFAGPFTVSHHRSTLLIAGMFSFFNAGSGANQSNHLYRTGPVHQGIHRRGVKFGSGAYILSPALTGAFTLVSGSHKSNHDTESFPFSYLIEEEGKSYLMPAANLRSFGTARDCKKWPARDKRTESSRDIIDFDKFSPYIIQNIVRAVETSNKLLEKPNSSGVYTHNRVKIKGTMLRHGLGLYQTAISIFLGEILAQNIEAVEYSGLWVDMAGMIAPKELINNLLDKIEDKEIADLDILQKALFEVHSLSKNYAAGWALNLAAEQLGKPVDQLSEQDLAELIARGQKAAENLESLNAEDAKKDSAIVMSTGYGADDPCCDKESDFLNIRQSQAK